MEDQSKLAFLAGSALFLELMDTSLLSNLTIPLAHIFNVSPDQIAEPILSYTIGSCLFIPLVAWLCKNYSPIRLLLMSILAFLVSSLACGLASDLTTFTLARFFQGVSISFAAPVAMIMLMERCTEDKVAFYVGMVNMPGLIGIAIGPVVGGFFSHYASWRYAFYINVPTALFLCVFIYIHFIRHSFMPAIKEKVPFDFSGFLFSSLAIVLISTGVELLAQKQSHLSMVALMLGTFCLLFYLLLWWRRRETRVLDLGVFSNTKYLLGALINCITRIGMAGVPVAISIYLHQHFQFSVLQTGFYLAVIGAMAATAKLMTGFLNNLGLEKSLALSILGNSISIYSAQYLTNNVYSMRNLLILTGFGFFQSTLYTCMNAIMLVDIKKPMMGNACNIQSIIQKLFIGFGIVFALCLPGLLHNFFSNAGYIFSYYCNLSALIVASAMIFIAVFHRKHITTFCSCLLNLQKK
ncbi:MFS transporter [Candidatus Sororendozoicomonas aggregata]|uniref:MFS transporter n=1 Tax=Candidatus Sororendozoicomonas aggregata TaxID=3073239 RepID=UPI002ED531C9